MKINVEVDCTPEEARRFMGLPDFTPVHDKYVSNILESMDKGVTPEMMDTLFRSWAPMGEAGMTMWRKMFDQVGGGSSSS
jgi:3-methyladenine DNA glycosylase/8-oxoguanine DNA glycosylase